ncbi:DUF6303 family protein [Streptomyces sp. XY332]|uniref:DUF6303 family protein n=1 Tax=Streptomyces sp. XY332 TaxID=1415561 RepID=UPI0006B1C666|nr:DUF6303 family protein [Streptomyces sp. XY332]KOY59064.1 hypothetical protein ADK59_04490 [Streptomyces sp. XY332]
MRGAHLVYRGGRWRLFVTLPGRGAHWPTHYFAGQAAPSVQERSRALTSLGFALADGAEWSWTEDTERFGDPASPVILIAYAPVEPVVGGAS